MGSGSGNFSFGCLIKSASVIFTVLLSSLGLAVLGFAIYSLTIYIRYNPLHDKFVLAIPIALIVFGVVVLVTSASFTMGMFTRRGKCLYIAFILLILLIVITVGFLLVLYIPSARMVFTEQSTKLLSDAIENYGKRDYNKTTEVWDSIQTRLHCCGVNNFTDWAQVTFSLPNTVPDSCCIVQEAGCGNGTLALADPSTEIYGIGCLDAVIGLVLTNHDIAAGVAIGILVVLAVYLILVLLETFGDNSSGQKK